MAAATITCCVGDGADGHHPFCENQPRGIEVRGVIAKNGLGELCFFADSRAEGFPLFREGGGPMQEGWDDVAAAILAAPARRVSHQDLADLLDPPPDPLAHSCDRELRADPAYRPFTCQPVEWQCSCGRRFVHVCDEAEGCTWEAIEP